MQRISINMKSLQKYIILVITGIIFGNVLHEIVMYFDKGDDKTVFPMGTMMAFGFILGFMLYLGSTEDAGRFNLIISLGGTRKEYLYGKLLEYILELVIGGGLALACNRYEMWKFDRFYGDIPVEADLSIVFSWKIFIPIFILLSAISFTASICIMKYGNNAMVALYFVFIFICIGLPRIFDMLAKYTDFSKLMTNVEYIQYILVVLAILISAIMFIISSRVILKQEVR